jgi:hypothetical protein
MIDDIKNLFTGGTKGVGLVRAILLALGTAVATGQVPLPPEYAWIGVVLAAIAGAVRSSTSAET